MKTKLGNTVIAIAIAATMVFAIGCSDDDSVVNVPVPETKPAISNLAYGATSAYATLDDGRTLRAVHASPDAPPVDVYVSGSGGSYTVELRGAGAGSSTAPVFTVDVTIPANQTVTAVAAGLFGSSSDDDKFRILPYVENFGTPGANEAIVRIVHASPDAGTVDLDVGDNGSVDFPNLARFGETGDVGLGLPSGAALQIAIWAAGSRVTAFTTPQLPEGAELFVIATGLLSKKANEPDGFTLLAVAPTGSVGFIKQNPVVFALHASPDAPGVDIYAGATKLVTDLVFGELSQAIQVPPAAYDLDFKATGQSATAATLTTPPLAAGERYLAIASGFLADNPDFRLLAFGDSFGTAGANALVRVIHASPDAPAVDVGTVDNNVVTPVGDFTGLAFEGESANPAGTALPAATLPIGIAGAGDTTPVATFTVPTVAGLKAFAIAAGAFTPEGQQEGFRLLIVNATDSQWTVAEILPN
jgi:hypothetical protein